VCRPIETVISKLKKQAILPSHPICVTHRRAAVEIIVVISFLSSSLASRYREVKSSDKNKLSRKNKNSSSSGGNNSDE